MVRTVRDKPRRSSAADRPRRETPPFATRTFLGYRTWVPAPGWLPQGSDHIAHFARLRGLHYEGRPDEGFFRDFEPHDTLVSPQHFFNAVRYRGHAGDVCLVEPWTAFEGLDPLERSILAFGSHPAPRRRAALRVGEGFLTKVAFLEAAPAPRVTLGDKVWDENVATFAASTSEALAALPHGLRELLKHRGFRGHLEVRPGAFVIHMEGLVPRPDHYDTLMRVVSDVSAALGGR